jgi:hypothetical protein
MSYPPQQSHSILETLVPLFPSPEGVYNTSGLATTIDQPLLQPESCPMNPLPRLVVGSQKTKQLARKRRYDTLPSGLPVSTAEKDSQSAITI